MWLAGPTNGPVAIAWRASVSTNFCWSATATARLFPSPQQSGWMMQRGVRGTPILVTPQPTTSHDPARREDSRQGRDVPRVPARPCP
jgi:hypothetical protein